MRRAIAGLPILLLVAVTACAWPLPPLPEGAAPTGEPVREPDVGYQPMPESVARKMLALAEVKPTDVVFDLGSGDGRVPIAAARDYGARGVGIELEPRLVAVARANAQAAGVSDRVRFVEGDIFKADLSEATVVTLFLWPSVNNRLAPKLLAELKPGTRVVSYYHDIDGWKAEQTVSGSLLGRIRLWRIPADRQPPSG